jgi:hypothetical protein
MDTELVATHLMDTELVATHLMDTELVATHLTDTELVATHLMDTELVATHLMDNELVATHLYLYPTSEPHRACNGKLLPFYKNSNINFIKLLDKEGTSLAVCHVH